MTQVALFACLLLSLRGNGRKDRAPSLHAQVRLAIEPLGGADYDIILEDAGDSKSAATKCLRQIYNLGLRDAWRIIEQTPSVVKLAVSKQEVDFVAAHLADCGATVKIVKKSE